MIKNKIKITESQLNNVIKETVKKILNEATNGYDNEYQQMAKELPRLKLSRGKRYQDIMNALKDYIDSKRHDLKTEYEEFYYEVTTYCKTWESNNITFYCEPDSNDAHILPSLYTYCIEKIKRGY